VVVVGFINELAKIFQMKPALLVSGVTSTGE
jgi:hypothetical protein